MDRNFVNFQLYQSFLFFIFHRVSLQVEMTLVSCPGSFKVDMYAPLMYVPAAAPKRTADGQSRRSIHNLQNQ